MVRGAMTNVEVPIEVMVSLILEEYYAVRRKGCADWR
jgi:hypothetical protein